MTEPGEKQVWTNVDPPEIEASVRAICGSDAFKKCQRVVPLLRHLVVLAISGAPASEFSYQALSLDLYHVPEDKYDPRLDGKARGYMKTLRSALKNYREGDGRGADVTVTIDRTEDNLENVPRIAYNPDNGPPLDAAGNASLLSLDFCLAAAGIHAPEVSRQAIALIENELTKSPEHPKLLVRLAWVQFMSVLREIEKPAEMLPATRKTLDRVWDTGAKLWVGFLVEAGMKALVEWEWARALQLIEEAERRRGESCWDTEIGIAVRAAHGEFEPAAWVVMRRLQQQVLWSDVTAMIQWTNAMVCARRYRDVEPYLRFLKERVAGTSQEAKVCGHWAILSEALGEPEWVMEVADKLDAGLPRAMLKGLIGQRDEALAIYRSIARNRRSAEKEIGYGLYMALLALGLGRTGASVRWLTRAVVVEQSSCVFWLMGWPFLRHLYGHPRFQELVRERLKLPAAINAV